MTAGWWDTPLVLRDLAKEISITTFSVWKNKIGKGGIKYFFKGGGIKQGGAGGGGGGRIIWKGEWDKYPLRTMSDSSFATKWLTK